MEQFTNRRRRSGLRDGSVVVYGSIADACDQDGLVEDSLPHRLLERGLMQQRAKVVLVREAERCVSLVDPVDDQLRRTACVEARCARVGLNRRLGLIGSLQDVRPFIGKEAEVTHSSP